jgi:hypothetical protein
MQYYLATKRNKLFIQSNELDHKGIILSENVSLKGLHIVWSHLYDTLEMTKL